MASRSARAARSGLPRAPRVEPRTARPPSAARRRPRAPGGPRRRDRLDALVDLVLAPVAHGRRHALEDPQRGVLDRGRPPALHLGAARPRSKPPAGGAGMAARSRAWRLDIDRPSTSATPYASRARPTLRKPARTSSRTRSGSRRRGSPWPPPLGEKMLTTSPGSRWSTSTLPMSRARGVPRLTTQLPEVPARPPATPQGSRRKRSIPRAVTIACGWNTWKSSRAARPPRCSPAPPVSGIRW